METHTLMKACRYTAYGPPEVVHTAMVPRPVPRDNELLVKVHYATVNRTDTGFRSAEYFVTRFWSGLFKPKLSIPGCEFSGTVEQVGEKVTGFRQGDRVFGYNDATFGCNAEYLTIAGNAAVAHMPANFSFRQAAALTEGAHYALCDIRAARLEPNSKVLVYGATGAIGSAAVQILAAMEMHVTAVCGTAHTALVKGLGAEKVIDYQTEDFTRAGNGYHLVFDSVGKSSFTACKQLLAERGVYISTELGKRGSNIWLALAGNFYTGRKVLFPLPVASKEDTLYLKQLADSGKLTPVIDREYTMEQIAEAHAYAQSGTKTGNVLLKIFSED